MYQIIEAKLTTIINWTVFFLQILMMLGGIYYCYRKSHRTFCKQTVQALSHFVASDRCLHCTAMSHRGHYQTMMTFNPI